MISIQFHCSVKMLLRTSLRAKYIPNGHLCFPLAREQANGLCEGLQHTANTRATEQTAGAPLPAPHEVLAPAVPALRGLL